MAKRKTARHVGMRRLRKLGEFLRDEVKDEWVDMGCWASLGFYQHACGTTACAVGWCPSAFPRQWTTNRGLKVFGRREQYPKLKGVRGCNPLRDAVRFFALTEEEADRLFIPDDDPSRLTVAKRLIRFADTNGKE